MPPPPAPPQMTSLIFVWVYNMRSHLTVCTNKHREQYFNLLSIEIFLSIENLNYLFISLIMLLLLQFIRKAKWSFQFIHSHNSFLSNDEFFIIGVLRYLNLPHGKLTTQAQTCSIGLSEKLLS